MSSNQLQRSFGQGQAIRFDEGNGELTRARLLHSSGSTAEVYLQGGQVTSWRVPTFGEVLFMSSKANFEVGKAIRGGIPIVFPQFGPGPMPSHGFARTSNWDVLRAEVMPDETVSLLLKLEATQRSLEWWPRRFRIELGIHLSANFGMSFKLTNIDHQAFTFQHAFHTYFQIRSIRKSVVSGLHDMTYVDQLEENARKKDTRRILTFNGEIDRIYENVPRSVTILDPVYKRKVVISKRNMSDYVVWNPWEEKSRTMPDMVEGAFQNMLCIEAGNICQPIEVQPGQHFETYMNLSVLSISAPDPDSDENWPGLTPN